MSDDRRDPDSLRARVDSLERVPALVRDRHLSVLASNALARSLSPGFAEGVNLARYAFIESADCAGASGWDAATSQIAAMLRESLDNHQGDGPFRRIVGELSATSAAFSEAWADEAPPARQGVATFLDTEVGDLTLLYREEWLDDSQAEALMLLFGVDSDNAEKLEALASIIDNGRSAGT
ncbi:hypothetical protein ACFXP7_12265 [Microbacterium sp. P06]|uniref:MmyB family transcriptional regulator n=1 Tax=Microbacterium sp. P06 TaxID=3366949 RepID=UPI0037456801